MLLCACGKRTCSMQCKIACRAFYNGIMSQDAHCVVPLRFEGRLPLRLRSLGGPPRVLGRRRSDLQSERSLGQTQKAYRPNSAYGLANAT